MTAPKCPICDAAFNDWCTEFHIPLAIKKAQAATEAAEAIYQEIADWQGAYWIAPQHE